MLTLSTHTYSKSMENTVFYIYMVIWRKGSPKT